MSPPRYEVIGVEALPEIRRGDDLARLIVDAAARQGTPLLDRDMLVISQKIVSKSEGRVVRLSDVTPSPGPARWPRSWAAIRSSPRSS